MKKVFLTLCIFLVSMTTIGKEDTVKLDPPKISKENLWKEILESGIKFPEFAFAQAILESGTFTSRVFKTNNNLFGMKVPKKRETVAINKLSSGYAKYFHWTSSVQDYLLFQNHIMLKCDTKEKYVAYLSTRYAETNDYIKRLYRVIKENKRIIDP